MKMKMIKKKIINNLERTALYIEIFFFVNN